MIEHPSLALDYDHNTEVLTSVVSYLYTCPVCMEARRYAIPPDGWNVYCNGLDFRTDTQAEPHDELESEILVEPELTSQEES